MHTIVNILACSAIDEFLMYQTHHFNKQDLESDSFQLVVQYLTKFAKGLSLDKFSYVKDSMKSSTQECLDVLLRYVNCRMKSFVQC